MLNYDIAKKYCSEDISLIENFEIAATDTVKKWVIHHRNEIIEHKTRAQLINENRYYGVPAAELIFLTISEHMELHGKNRLDEHKQHMSIAASGENNGMYGKHHSDETRAKISRTRKERIASGEIKVVGTVMSDETKNKISAKAKQRLSDQTKHPMYGRRQSEETRRKISEAKKGKTPWNKGIKKAGN